MKALLLHCRNYSIKLERLANRPKNISPEEVKEKEQVCKDCIVALITVEKEDSNTICPKLLKEIASAASDTKHKNVVLLPFAHLSNNLADSKTAISIIEGIEKELAGYNVLRAHFGSHKELLLDIYGHPGNARYREF